MLNLEDKTKGLKYEEIERKNKKIGYKTGKIIHKERIELNNISQEELGKKIEDITGKSVKRQTISNWEYGITTPDLKQLVALSKIFNCDISYLLGDSKFKRADSLKLMELTGLSEKACDSFIELKKRNNTGTINIMSALLEDMDVLQKIIDCCYADYGSVSEFFDISDPLSPHKKRPILLRPKMLRKADTMELYSILCEFVDRQRKNNGLPTSDEL